MACETSTSSLAALLSKHSITPLPAGITRKSVLDMYRDHLAMIDLNPLVVERFKCRPPSYAPTDEYWAMWYTIKGEYCAFTTPECSANII